MQVIVSKTPGAIKQFCRLSWRFQQTVVRPAPRELPAFVAKIVEAHGPTAEATIIIDKIVFGTTRLSVCCGPDSPPLDRDISLTAQSGEEIKALLVAAFMDGPDFSFVPAPRSFVFYADHDDWVTFFSNKRSHLDQVIAPLAAAGYKLIPEWTRVF